MLTLICSQLIELWETFLMQLDAEEDGQMPFYKPPPEPTAGDPASNLTESRPASNIATAADVALEQDA
jgi:sorting nexin-1/2